MMKGKYRIRYIPNTIHEITLNIYQIYMLTNHLIICHSLKSKNRLVVFIAAIARNFEQKCQDEFLEKATKKHSKQPEIVGPITRFVNYHNTKPGTWDEQNIEYLLAEKNLNMDELYDMAAADTKNLSFIRGIYMEKIYVPCAKFAQSFHDEFNHLIIQDSLASSSLLNSQATKQHNLVKVFNAYANHCATATSCIGKSIQNIGSLLKSYQETKDNKSSVYKELPLAKFDNEFTYNIIDALAIGRTNLLPCVVAY